MHFPNDIWQIIKNHLFLRLFHYCDGSITAYDARDQDTYLRILEQDTALQYVLWADQMLEDEWPQFYPRELDFDDDVLDDHLHGIPLIDLTGDIDLPEPHSGFVNK